MGKLTRSMLLASLALTVQAGQIENYQAAIKDLDGIHQQGLETLLNASVNSNPAFTTDDPDEVALVDKDLKHLGEQAVLNDEQHREIYQHFYQAPKYVWDEDDSALQQARISQENAADIVQDTEPAFCLDGDCTQVNDHAFNEADFIQTASQLASLEQASQEVNSSSSRVFKGAGLQCRKKAAGFSNCCADRGWGQDIGLASCNSTEKRLGQAKQDKLCAYVGEYCAKRILGVCLTRKKSYCCFEHTLAAIVQIQGRSQLGLNYGNVKAPNCRGLRISEVQKIDFADLDFTNFSAELHSQLDIRDESAVQAELTARINQFYQQSQ